ncbi:MAG: hypothetical protein ACTS2F_19580 [Thainema sp.]
MKTQRSGSAIALSNFSFHEASSAVTVSSDIKRLKSRISTLFHDEKLSYLNVSFQLRSQIRNSQPEC